MALFPSLSLGWLNGWIPISLFYGIFLLLLKVFPKRDCGPSLRRFRLDLEQARPAKIGLPFALAAMVLILFTPLKIYQADFWIGLYWL